VHLKDIKKYESIEVRLREFKKVIAHCNTTDTVLVAKTVPVLQHILQRKTQYSFGMCIYGSKRNVKHG